MKIHELKTLTKYYQDVCNNLKNFEFRKNDRGYKVGDILVLVETKFVGKDYIECKTTGNWTIKKVTYVLQDFPGIDDDYCILNIQDATMNDIPKKYHLEIMEDLDTFMLDVGGKLRSIEVK